jgi:hypothetical protein
LKELEEGRFSRTSSSNYSHFLTFLDGKCEIGESRSQLRRVAHFNIPKLDSSTDPLPFIVNGFLFRLKHNVLEQSLDVDHFDLNCRCPPYSSIEMTSNLHCQLESYGHHGEALGTVDIDYKQ